MASWIVYFPDNPEVFEVVNTRFTNDLPAHIKGRAFWKNLDHLGKSQYHIVTEDGTHLPAEFINHNWYLLQWTNRQYTIKQTWKIARGDYETGWYRITNQAHSDYRHLSPLKARVTSDLETLPTTEGSWNNNAADDSIINIRVELLNFELSQLEANLQTELNINWPDPLEPEPPIRDSPALRTMSLWQAAGALQDIFNAMDVSVASPPPVYALAHPLGLPHNAMPFVTQMPQESPLQVATTTVATTLTHASLS